MPWQRYFLFSVTVGAAWLWCMSLVGFFLVSIRGVTRYLHLIILAVIFLSILPAVIEVWRQKRADKIHH